MTAEYDKMMMTPAASSATSGIGLTNAVISGFQPSVGQVSCRCFLREKKRVHHNRQMCTRWWSTPTGRDIRGVGEESRWVRVFSSDRLESKTEVRKLLKTFHIPPVVRLAFILVLQYNFQSDEFQLFSLRYYVPITYRSILSIGLLEATLCQQTIKSFDQRC